MPVSAAELLEDSAYITEEPLAWAKSFRGHDQYDWTDPEYLERNADRFGYRVIPLTKGYFALVSPEMYQLVTEFHDGKPKRWCAATCIDRYGDLHSVYAVRRGRVREGEPLTVYMHREITGALGTTDIVDHKNGCGLDNRGSPDNPVNLRRTSRSENETNKPRKRRVNGDLPQGVIRTEGGKFKGRRYQVIEGKLKQFRSPLCDTVEEALAWYNAQLAEIFSRREWRHNPASVNWPVFPPHVDAEPSERSLQLRRLSREPLPVIPAWELPPEQHRARPHVRDDVPF